MNLPIVDKSVAGKRVLVRGDIDVPLSPFDDSRLKNIKPTIDFLLDQNCQVILAGHIGRPGGKVVSELSTKPIQEWVSRKVGKQVRVLENLRFDPREEANDESLAGQLAAMADIYVNEAFADSERAHASIVGVPKLLPHFAGFWLAQEVEQLSIVQKNPHRPLLIIIGGVKWETKAPLAEKMKAFADEVVVSRDLELTAGGNDVTLDAVYSLQLSISNAGTIVWNGPIGKVEDITYQVGTRKLAELIVASPAVKITGGGDTVAFLDKLGLTDKFDWVSSGGGSMLKFLAGEELPGIEALMQ
ncbi:MAG: phosphoglycerate kinase [Patescibacteria group bacterium]|nr:phosphoglycerate kinase [Patescibacteria group bacterium]MCL5431934.1 phosphoglycerate kinase [Patescibacteria group bacterium]